MTGVHYIVVLGCGGITVRYNADGTVFMTNIS